MRSQQHFLRRITLDARHTHGHTISALLIHILSSLFSPWDRMTQSVALGAVLQHLGGRRKGPVYSWAVKKLTIIAKKSEIKNDLETYLEANANLHISRKDYASLFTISDELTDRFVQEAFYYRGIAESKLAKACMKSGKPELSNILASKALLSFKEHAVTNSILVDRYRLLAKGIQKKCSTELRRI